LGYGMESKALWNQNFNPVDVGVVLDYNLACQKNKYNSIYHLKIFGFIHFFGGVKTEYYLKEKKYIFESHFFLPQKSMDEIDMGIKSLLNQDTACVSF